MFMNRALGLDIKRRDVVWEGIYQVVVMYFKRI